MSYQQQVSVYPSSLNGTITAPVSKSAMQRACVAALLHKGRTIIRNPGRSNDDTAMLQVIQQLGATVDDQHDHLVIDSDGVHPVHDSVNCGESGLGVRMFTPVAALCNKPISINGSGSLLTRPLNFFDEVLPQLQVHVQSGNGYLPLRVKGPLQPGNITVDGSLSSQFLTGLLMAYSAANASGVTITVNHLASKPYIDLTLQVMRHFRMPVPENDRYERFYFPGNIPLPNDQPVEYTVEGDWSGGAFLLVAAAIAGDVTVKGLDMNSAQADKAIMQALNMSGAGITVARDSVRIKSAPLKSFRFDATDCPDLFPPLVALAAYGEGDSLIKGVHRLAHKESNRGISLQQELKKMGVEILLDDDLMTVRGGSEIKGAVVHSHNDHRIAMACAVAALRAKDDTIIEAADAVKKSYPGFYDDLKSISHRNTGT